MNSNSNRTGLNRPNRKQVHLSSSRFEPGFEPADPADHYGIYSNLEQLLDRAVERMEDRPSNNTARTPTAKNCWGNNSI